LSRECAMRDARALINRSTRRIENELMPNICRAENAFDQP
jgi:hypothetical protein